MKTASFLVALVTTLFQAASCRADADGCNDSVCPGRVERTVLESHSSTEKFSGTAKFIVNKLTAFDNAGVFTKDFVVDADLSLSRAIASVIAYSATLPANVFVSNVAFSGQFSLKSLGHPNVEKSVSGSFDTKFQSGNAIEVLRGIQISDFSLLAGPGVALTGEMTKYNDLELVHWSIFDSVNCERNFSQIYELTPTAGVSELLLAVIHQNSLDLTARSNEEVACPKMAN